MKQPHAKFNGHFYTAHDLESKAIFNIGFRSPGGLVNFIFHVKHVTQLSRANREVLRREQDPATIEPPSIVCAVHVGMILPLSAVIRLRHDSRCRRGQCSALESVGGSRRVSTLERGDGVDDRTNTT